MVRRNVDEVDGAVDVEGVVADGGLKAATTHATGSGQLS
jgi:hypothetical protein